MEIMILYNQEYDINLKVSFRLDGENGVIYRCDDHDEEWNVPKPFLAHLTLKHRNEVIDNETNQFKNTYKILRRLSHRFAKEFSK